MIRKPADLSEKKISENPFVFKRFGSAVFSGKLIVFSEKTHPEILTAASVIADELSSQTVLSGKDSFLPQSFYIDCAGKMFSRTRLWDSATVIIFLKQTAMLMRSAGIVAEKDGKLGVDRSGMTAEALFSAFWHYESWKEIFPSVPEFADILQRNKTLLIELILAQDKSFSISSFSEEFLSISGVRLRNFLLFSSYVDFSVISMLVRFGILEYVSGEDEISVRLSRFGRSFLYSAD